jgi:hypothetical protein
MNSTYSDAPILAGTRGAGNIIALSTHPKHTTRKTQATQGPTTPADPRAAASKLLIDVHLSLADKITQRVRLFLGPSAVVDATKWCRAHGQGTAMALPDGEDPSSMHWPAVAMVKVVASPAYPEPFDRLVDLAAALKRAGVGYAAIDHDECWPNLWIKDVGGGA